MRPPDDDDGMPDAPALIQVRAIPRDDGSTCLRPLGLCELGSCDVCWYSPEARARMATGQGPDHVPGTPGRTPKD